MERRVMLAAAPAEASLDSSFNQPTGALGINLNNPGPLDSQALWTDVSKNFSAWQYASNGTVLSGSDVTALGFPSGTAASNNATAYSYLVGYPSGNYQLQYQGTATIGISGIGSLVSGSLSYNASTDTTTATVAIHDQSGVALTLTASGLASSDPLQNFHLMMPGFSANTTQIVNPNVVSRLGVFSTIRLMDAFNTNSDLDSSWSQLTLPNSFSFAGATGVAYVDAIALGNETHSNLWWNIPVNATDAFVTSLADLLKYGADANGNPYTSTQASPVYAPLNPGLKVHIEYGNELENFTQPVAGPNQTNASANVTAKILDGSLQIDGEQELLRLHQMYVDFQTVYSGNFSSQIGFVFAGAFSDSGPDAFTSGAFTFAGENNGLAGQNNPANWGPVNSWLEAVAMSKYEGVNSGQSPTTLDQLFSYMNANLAADNSTAAETYLSQSSINVPLYGYEGGQSLWGGDPNSDALFLAAQSDPRMATFYQALIDQWYTDGGGLLNLYLFASPNANGQSWGLLPSEGLAGSTKWDAVIKRLVPMGDATLDGNVDYSDFQVLESNWGSTTAYWQTGDFNGDGIVNQSDLTLLQQNLNTSSFTSAQLSTYNSFVSSVTGASTPTTPGMPTVSVPVTSSSVSITWPVSTDSSGIANYLVFRNGTQVASVTTNSFSDTGLSASSSYVYTVEAVDNANQTSSASGALTVNTTAPLVQLSGAIIGTSGSYENIGNTIAKAFDGNLTTFVDGPDFTGDWVGLDFGSAKTISAITYAPRIHDSTTAYEVRMEGGEFQYASDANFTNPITFYTITATPPDGYTTVQLGAPITARYVRYIGPTNSSDNIAELSFYSGGATTAATPPTVPGTPSVLVPATASGVTIQWAPSTSSVGIDHYVIVRSSGGTTQSFTTTGTTFADTNLSSSTTYSYSVEAVDDSGNTSAASSALAVTTQTVAPAAPGTPTISTPATSSTVGISWTASPTAGVTGYIVLRTSGGTTQSFTTSGTTFSDTGLSASTTYSYTVEAVIGSTPSAASGALSVSTLAQPLPSAPGTPTISTPATNSTVGISWAASSTAGVTGYIVLRTSGGVTQSFSTSGTTYSDTGLGPSTTYSYTVEAVVGSATSPASGALSVTTAALAAPGTPIVSTPATSSTVGISWSPSTSVGVTGYIVLRTSGGTTQSFSTSGTTFSDTGLSAATSYSYAVESVDAASDVSAPSAALAVTTPAAALAAPGTPTVSTAATTSTVGISWTASPSTSVTGYTVLRTSGGTTQSFTTSGTTFSDTGLSASTTYSYTVEASDGFGDFSAPSGALSVTTAAPAAPAAPGTPTITTAATSSTVGISWTASPSTGVTGYTVLRTSGGVTQSFNTSGLTFSDTGLSASTSYSYTVEAVAGTTVSTPSAALSVTTAAAAPTAPGTPTITTAATSSTVGISWTASTSSGVTGYIVLRTSGGVTQSFTTSATTYSDTGLSASTSYSYTVEAVAGSSTSVASGALSVTTPAATTPVAAPGTPTITTAATSSTVGISWTASTTAGVTSYIVLRTSGGVTQSFTTSGTTYSDTGLSASTSYSYTVEAVAGSSTSVASGALSVTTPAATTVVAAPGTPTITTAATSSTVGISWTASTSSGVTGYIVLRTSGGVTQSFTTSGTTYSDTGLSASTTYSYTVEAVVGSAMSVPSGALSVTTAAAAVATQLTGTVIGTTGSYDGVSTRDKAFDGSTSTFFDAASANGDWTGLDLGSAYTISSISYAPRVSFETRMVGGVFQASSTADFSSNVITLATISATPADGYTTISIPSSVYSGSPSGYRYVRYLSPNGTYGNVAEIKFIGTAGTTPVAPNAPGTPTITTAATSSTVGISWAASTTAGVTSYIVLRTSGGVTQSFTASGTTYSDTGLSASTTYSYTIEAVAGSSTSVASGALSVTTPAATTVVAAPGTPTITTAATSSTVGISWAASTTAGVTSYIVLRTSGGVTQSFTTSGTTYSDTGLSASTNYSYTVEAVAGSSTSVASGALSVTTTAAAAPTAPGTPTITTAATSSTVGISWAASTSSGVTGYIVLRTSGGVTQSFTTSGTTYSDTGLGASTSYSYTVEAVAGSTVSSPSGALAVTTTAAVASGQLTGTVIGTTGSYDGVSTRDKAFDGSTSTFFDAASANGDWTGLDLGSAYTISSISYAPRVSFETRMVGGVFQASSTADFSSNVITLATISATPVDGYTTISIPSSVYSASPSGYRYVRYLSPNGTYGNVAEIKFIGTAGTTPVAPNAPGTPTVTTAATSSTVGISWAASTSSGVTGYIVLRTSGGVTQSFTTSGTTYSDTGLSASTTYSYTIEAVAGGSTSVASGALSVTTPAATTPVVAPGTPTITTAATSSTVGISWAASTTAGVTSYIVLRTSGGVTQSFTTSGTTYSDTGLSASTTYSYTVEAVAGSSTSVASGALSVTTTAAAAPTAPGTPTITTAATSSTVGISWTGSTSSGVTGYIVLRTSGGVTQSFTTSGTTYSDTGLSASTTYSYTIEAVAGGSTSVASGALSVTTPAATTVVAAPGTPTITTAATSSTVGISWAASTSSGVTGYIVLRTSGGVTQSFTTSGTTYSDTGLSASTSYSYTVEAVVGSTVSSPSGALAVTTQAQAAIAAPGTPTITTAATSSTVGISWTASTTAGVTSYIVLRTSGGVTQSFTTSGTTYSDTGLSASTTYSYTIEAVVGSAMSVPSGAMSVTTAAAAASGQLTGTVIGTTGSYDGVSTRDKAFDGSLSTSVDAASANGDWTGLDLGSAYTISSISYAPRVSFETRMVGGVFQASSTADFSSNVITLATISATPTDGYTTISIPSSVYSASPSGYRYVRYLSPNGGYGNVAEIKFIGTAGTTPVAPNAPGTPTVTTVATSSTVGISWAASTSSGVTGYIVLRTSGGVTQSFTTSGTTYSDTGLSASTSYSYTVEAVIGSTVSSPSGALAVTTQAQAAIAAPGTPTITTAATSSTVGISWTASTTPGVTGYIVLRTSGGVTQSFTTSGTTYSDTGLSASTTYSYTVEAVMGSAMSVPSGALSVTTTAAPASGQLTGTVIGTTGSYDGVSTRDKAFDGSTSTFFDAASANGDWVGLDLKTPFTITSISYAPRVGYETRMVGGVFQVSSTADFSSNVITIATISATPADGYTTITIPSSVYAGTAGAYEYVRYLAPNGTYGNVADIKFFGH